MDKRISQLEVQWLAADEAYSQSNLETALALYTDIAGGVLRWFDQERFGIVRARQLDCLLGIAKRLGEEGRDLEAVRMYSTVLCEHSDIMTREVCVSARLERDSCICRMLVSGCDVDACSDMHVCVTRMCEVARPACVDGNTWSVWKKKDKSVVLPLLEARMEHMRDSSKVCVCSMHVCVCVCVCVVCADVK